MPQRIHSSDIVTGVRRRKSPRAVGGSNSDDWYTSAETEALALKLTGLVRFTLDVAACEERHLADTWYGPEQNGLDMPWFGDAFVNPPFSQCAEWVAKAWSEWDLAQRDVSTITMLLPANRTETSWWQENVEPFRDVLEGPRTFFLPGRAAFAYPGSKGAVKKGSTFGIVLVHWS